jgi:hypothetical protein
MTKQATCPECGKRFTPWRQKRFCSEVCRKRQQNARLGYVRRDGATTLQDDPKGHKQGLPDAPGGAAGPFTDAFREDGGFVWTACNEITRKLTLQGSQTAIAWAIQIEGLGWFGRIGKDFSFGPTSRRRAKQAVEARLKGEPFTKLEGERSWKGTCGKLLGLVERREDDDAIREAA